MPHRTFVHYKDQDGNERVQEEYFNAQTSFMAIIISILEWLWGDFAFDLQIDESQGKKSINFDEKYLLQHNPYNQPTPSEINLKILRNSGGKHRNSTLNTGQPVVNVTAPVIIQQRQEPANPIFSGLQAPNDVTMNTRNPSITFVINVNLEQSERGSEGHPNIQGKKDHLEDNTKHGQVPPKVKVRLDDIAEKNSSKLELMTVLVWEMCEKGIRKLYFHPHRKLVTDQDQPHGKCVRIPVSDEMLDEGDDLILPTELIHSGKSVNNTKRVLFCQLTNKYSAKTQYETGRLACLLIQNGNPLWNTLALSNSTIFDRPRYKIGYIHVTNDDDKFIETIYAQKFTQKRKQDLNQSVMLPLLKTSRSEQQVNTPMMAIPPMDNEEAPVSSTLCPPSIASGHNRQLRSANAEIRPNETAAHPNSPINEGTNLQEPGNRYQHPTNIPASSPVTTQNYFYEPRDYHQQTSTTINSALCPTTMQQVISQKKTQRGTGQLTDDNTQPGVPSNLLEIISSTTTPNVLASPTVPNTNHQSLANEELFSTESQGEDPLLFDNAFQSLHEKHTAQEVDFNSDFDLTNDIESFEKFRMSNLNSSNDGSPSTFNSDDLDIFRDLA